jgi:hypothetical protein
VRKSDRADLEGPMSDVSSIVIPVLSSAYAQQTVCNWNNSSDANRSHGELSISVAQGHSAAN